ncbi:sensor histidine kinase [Cellulomonas hominis]
MSAGLSTPRGVAAREDRHALTIASGLILGLFAVGTAVQTSFVYDHLLVGAHAVPVSARIGANLGAVTAMLGVLVGLRLHTRRSRWALAGGVVVAGVVGGLVRVLLQLLAGVYEPPSQSTWLAELLTTVVAAWIAGGIGAVHMLSRRGLREEVEQTARSALQIELALQALQHEEVRVRREVAEGLHGSLQQRLVLAVARLDRIVEHVTPVAAPADVTALRELREQLEALREGDVRATSRMLYPDQLEVGMVPAIRALLGRIPTSVATQLVVTDAVRALDDPAAPRLTQSERLLAVRVVEEAVTNALRHGAAARIAVQVDVAGPRLALAVQDDGVGFDPATVGRASGTARLASRLALVDGELVLSSEPGVGTRVSAAFPVSALTMADEQQRGGGIAHPDGLVRFRHRLAEMSSSPRNAWVKGQG